jgi:succinate dehydrogenase / fumarate reductase iron-sulfur subunit
MSGMNLKVKIWRQSGPDDPGRMVEYFVEDIEPDMSFLEMLDILNEQLIKKGEEPVAFDYDCREGICGSCAMMVDGVPHGRQPAVTVCQLFMRQFKDGDVIIVEPWRAKAFPIVKDLVVDRSAFDRIIAAGGYISVNTGAAPEANLTPVPRDRAEGAMDAASCIGCGACVAACKNASASLFVGAKISQLALLPQGEPERKLRAGAMVAKMDAEGFGSCTNEAECQAACPKEISTDFIVRMNREFMRSAFSRAAGG